jgi:hypothetical protein
MSTGAFPLNPDNRRAIIVLQEHEIEKCAYEKGSGGILVDSEAYVLPFPVSDRPNMPMALQNILNKNQARPGTMLIQSPFDLDVYEEVSAATQQFALAKHMYFTILCQHLGAREVIVDQDAIKISIAEHTIKVKGDKNGCTAEAEIIKKEREKFSAKLKLHNKFTGGSPNLEKAEQLLREKKLFADSSMKSLIEMRRYGANQITSQEIVLSLSSEANNNLKVVGKLKVPGFIKLSASYESLLNNLYEYTLTVKVEF